MKKIKYLSALFLLLCVTLPVDAATSTPDWSKLQIGGAYNKTTQEMTIASMLPAVTNRINSSYTINFRIDGTDYLQTFVYNDVNDSLSTSFVNFTKTLQTQYPYSYTIRSTKNTQVLSSYTGTLVFSGNTAISIGGTFPTGSGSSATGSTSTLSQNEKDAQSIFSIVLSTIPKSITTTSGKIDYLETVIDTLEAYIVRYPSRKTALDLAIAKLQVQITVYKNPIPKKGFVPMYKSRAEEPTTINGIGNSKSYNSWRVD